MCGLVRDTVAEHLLEWGENFINVNSLASLADCINNPSVVRFMMEHAVLSSIRSNGLAIGAGIGKPMEVKLLREPYEINTSIRGQPVLYWPRKFKFKAIDGIIVLISPEELQETRTKNAKVKRNKLLMFPFQITLDRPSHSDAHKKFFKDYGKWTQNISYFDVETQFIWITPGDRGLQMHPRSSDWPAHAERYIPFEDISTKIWQNCQNATRVARRANRVLDSIGQHHS